MNNFRLRIQLLVVMSSVLNILLWVIADFFRPHTYTTTEWVLSAGFMAVILLVILDGLLASYYLSIIASFHKLDERTLSALRDASVLRLRGIANKADRLMAEGLSLIEAALQKASDYPELLKSKEFERAVYGFKFEKAERMIVQAGRVLEHARLTEARRKNRQENRVGSLLEEGRSLGFSDGDMSTKSPTELREQIEQAKMKSSLRTRAQALGCSTHVEQLIEQESPEAANMFLIQSENLVRSAHVFGIEAAVRELLSYGNLSGVQRLIGDKKDEADLASFKAEKEVEIQKLPEHYRSGLKRLLEAVCKEKYASRGYRQKLHELEQMLEKSKA